VTAISDSSVDREQGRSQWLDPCVQGEGQGFDRQGQGQRHKTQGRGRRTRSCQSEHESLKGSSKQG